MSVAKSLYIAVFLIFNLKILAQHTSLPLIVNGKSEFVVVVGKGALKEEERAASLFRYFVKKGSGVNIGISGSASFEYTIFFKEDLELPSGAFNIVANKRSITFYGGRDNGVINGVCYFLRNYFGEDFIAAGVFLNPEIRQNVFIQIPLSIKRKPAFSSRTMHYMEGYDTDYIEYHALRRPFLRHSEYAHPFSQSLLKPSLYFKTHPEYFSFYNGRRDSAQPNLLHPEVVNIVKQEIGKKIMADKGNEYQYYSLGLNDNPIVNQDKETESVLRKGDINYTDIVLDFANSISKEYSNMKFTTLAYEQTKTPPKKRKPAKNVTVILTNADNDKSKSIVENDYDYIQKLHMKEIIPSWLLLDSNLIFWDYLSNYSNVLIPWPNIYTIKPNLQFYKKCGIKNLFLQGISWIPSENSELKAFMCANLMWDPNINDDSLVSIFCNQYYISSGPVMYNYIREINMQALNGNDILFTFDKPFKFRNTLFSFKNIQKWRTMVKAEEDSSEGIVRKRIMKERLGLEFLYINLSVEDRHWNNEINGQSLLTLLKKFEKDCSELNIISLTEGGYSVTNFANKTRQEIIDKWFK